MGLIVRIGLYVWPMWHTGTCIQYILANIILMPEESRNVSSAHVRVTSTERRTRRAVADDVAVTCCRQPEAEQQQQQPDERRRRPDTGGETRQRQHGGAGRQAGAPASAPGQPDVSSRGRR